MIARTVGVSTMTVSNALRRAPNVSATLRRRIEATAERLGYRPDPTLARLMMHLRRHRISRHQGNLGFIIPAENDYVCELTRGAIARASELGYSLEMFYLPKMNVRPARLVSILKARGIQGVLLGPLTTPGPASFLSTWDEIPAVALSYSLQSPRFHLVVPHQFHNSMLALRQLAQAGLRRAALLLPRQFDDRVFHTFSAALAWDAYAKQGGEPRIYLCDPASQKALRAWLRQVRADVLLVPYSFMREEFIVPALGKAASARWPVFTLGGYGADALPGVDQRIAEVGRSGVDQLVSAIHRGETGIPLHPSVTMIEGEWRSVP